MLREAAIAESTVGAQKLWLGYVELGPGADLGGPPPRRSRERHLHHLGQRAFFTGERLDQAHEAQPAISSGCRRTWSTSR